MSSLLYNINHPHFKDSYNTFKELLKSYENSKHDPRVGCGFWLHGPHNNGKTTYVVESLKKMGYDPRVYNCSHSRGKKFVDSLSTNNMSNFNVLSLMQGNQQKICFVMDNIEGLNSCDKGGLSALIKLIRGKRSKIHKNDDQCRTPVICVCSGNIDKKIRELKRVCREVSYKAPTRKMGEQIVLQSIDKLKDMEGTLSNETRLISKISNNIGVYLRGLKSFIDIINSDVYIDKISSLSRKKSKSLIESTLSMCENSVENVSTKKSSCVLMSSKHTLDTYKTVARTSEMSSIGLIIHENIADGIDTSNIEELKMYKEINDIYADCDYIDRQIFQKQSTFYTNINSIFKTAQISEILFTYLKYCEPSNKLLNWIDDMKEYADSVRDSEDIRFTKVLTKHSTEYNNSNFIQNIISTFNLDKRDTFALLVWMKHNMTQEQIYDILEGFNMRTVDVDRIFRFIDN